MLLGLEVQKYIYDLKQLEDKVTRAVSAIQEGEKNRNLVIATAESMKKLTSSMQAAKICIQFTLNDKEIELLGFGNQTEHSEEQASASKNLIGENPEEMMGHLKELRSYLRPLAESALISERSRVSRMGLEEGDRFRLEALFKKIDSCMSPSDVQSEETFRIHMLTQLLTGISDSLASLS